MTLDYESLFHRSHAGAFRLSTDGKLLDCNDACARILGYASRSELLEHGTLDYLNESDGMMVRSAVEDLSSIAGVEIGLKSKDGRPVWVLANLSIAEKAGQRQVEGLFFESTEQRLALERSEQQAWHDPLTALPNRTLFTDRLRIAMAQAKRHQRSLAVLMLDLDHFELINTTFGPVLADRVLRVVADRLVQALRIEDAVARYGSDEFVIALSEFGENENCAMIARRLLDAISKPENIEGHEIYVNATIGIALYPSDGTDVETLIKNADAAMYRAKQFGRNTYRLYQPEANARAFERQSIVTSLHRALDREEFVLHFQPEINVQTGKVEVIEALLRWKHPDMGLIQPASFLPAAEEGQLINAIGEWVVREACRQSSHWKQLGIPPIPMAINLSPRQFAYADLVRMVERAVHDFGIDPEMLELEVTHHAVHDPDRALPRLDALKGLGVRIAIDDFGTGRASLADLKKMPIDAVKIDTSFIRNVTTQSDDASIVEAVIRMARGLDIRVVAEGVETKDQMTFLWNRRCTDMQGFFFGRPMPGLALEETLRMQGH